MAELTKPKFRALSRKTMCNISLAALIDESIRYINAIVAAKTSALAESNAVRAADRTRFSSYFAAIQERADTLSRKNVIDLPNQDQYLAEIYGKTEEIDVPYNLDIREMLTLFIAELDELSVSASSRYFTGISSHDKQRLDAVLTESKKMCDELKTEGAIDTVESGGQ